MTILQVLQQLDSFVDSSDPDFHGAQVFHAYQTAERARQLFPDDKWMHLVGLIHDVGKIVSTACGNFPQPFVVGDTFPVGCKFSPHNVFPSTYEASPDFAEPLYNTPTGMYSAGCGLRNLLMSFGHDEYMYRTLMDNSGVHTLPAEALYIIRFHSFYAHHHHNGYEVLLEEADRKLLSPLLRFQSCDLYSKSETLPDVKAVESYYAGLLAEFGLDAPLNWKVLELPEAVRTAYEAAEKALDAELASRADADIASVIVPMA
jgi:inositol oxygenase